MRMKQLRMTARQFLDRVCASHPDDGTIIGQAGHQFVESVLIIPDKFDDFIDMTD